MDSDIGQVGLQPKVAGLLNPDMRVPGPVANRISGKFDRHLPRVSDEGTFLFEEDVLTVGSKEHKEAAVSEVLNVCVPGGFAPSPGCLSDREAVLGDELCIHCARRFSFW